MNVFLAQAPCWHAFGYGPMLLWGGAALIFLLAGAVALGWLFGYRRQQIAGHATTSARTILAERFARGELSEEDYRRQLDVLG
ncbi:putative membrane protein [Crossiella equi]|uniref:Membrane protein n=1 Tax=Crossiella equi TaxID=130796 RepID=A0ABS5A6B3_9PSEU|nr:SHOCT domain-containing protein [Crossiella equi]MBP2471846.1 putative membrane protein [Crossiella equi]